MSISLSDKELNHLAELARLRLSTEEAAIIGPQLSEVIDYNVQLLAEVDVAEVLPTAQTTGLSNVWQEDVARPSLDKAIALDQAPWQRDGLFVVPAVKE